MMKNRDFKMRMRFEQKEYYPDKYGETRVDRILNRKLSKQQEKEKYAERTALNAPCNYQNNNGNHGKP